MSPKAEEFISDEGVLECLDYAEKNKNNRALIEQILEKAAKMKGVSHKEAIVLLDCELDDLNEKIYALAEKIKKEFYGNRIVMFAPLYLSNYCINGCEYCPYHARNKHITRKKMTQEEIRREVIALQDMGHKRLAIEAGEDPVNNPLEYILRQYQDYLQHQTQKRRDPPCQRKYRCHNGRELHPFKGSRHRYLHPVPGNL